MSASGAQLLRTTARAEEEFRLKQAKVHGIRGPHAAVTLTLLFCCRQRRPFNNLSSSSAPKSRQARDFC
jgi:hypothetical protein